ncbi:MAG: GIY-YIG nuclease family protein [Candidatus Onthomonas sp.]|nr:GIY-YIG nuclease family protein [Candidatus Onthomonas sp.]
MNYTYVLKCADGTFCTGWTNHLERRLAAHNAGTASKYPRSRRPVELYYFETFPTKEAAMRREWQIKQLRHSEKQALKQQQSLPG